MSVVGPFLGFVAVLAFCFAWIAVAHRLRLRHASRRTSFPPQAVHCRVVYLDDERRTHLRGQQ